MAGTRGLGHHVLLAISLFGLSLTSCGVKGFYLPGVAPKSYRNKENVSHGRLPGGREDDEQEWMPEMITKMHTVPNIMKDEAA